MSHSFLLCPGDDCPLKSKCKRFLTKARGRQDFFGTPPFEMKATCSSFIENTDEIFFPNSPKRPLKLLNIWIDKEVIQRGAYYLYLNPKSISELYWRLAKSSIQLQNSLPNINYPIFQSNPLILNQIGFNPQPDKGLIQERVDFLTRMKYYQKEGDKLANLHWEIAYQEYLVNCIIIN
jgi:hypothetical protein